jgi:hypothetical protein
VRKKRGKGRSGRKMSRRDSDDSDEKVINVRLDDL